MCENKIIPVNMSGNELTEGTEAAHCLNANDQRKIFGAHQKRTMVGVSFSNGEVGEEIDTAHCLCGNYATKEGLHSHQSVTKVIMPVLTPEREQKRQNGRRFKNDGEEMFTLTAQDRHGVALGVLRNVRSEYGKEIRKDYEAGNIDISRHKFLEHEIREDGVSNTVDSVQKDNLVAVEIKEATKQGYAIAHEGDSINLSMPDSKTRRGRVGGGGGADIGHKLQSGSDSDDSGEYP